MADLKRTLFGYSSASVRLLLTERMPRSTGPR
jgi:hypothetical protein